MTKVVKGNLPFLGLSTFKLKNIDLHDFYEEVSNEIRTILNDFNISVIFILTDPQRNIVDIQTNDLHAKELIESSDISVFSKLFETFGVKNLEIITEKDKLINPISFNLKEFSIPLFSDWSGVYLPFLIKNKLNGYIAVIFKNENLMELVIPFLKVLHRLFVIKKSYSAKNLFLKMIEEKLNKYNLTPREREVATRWMSNKTVQEVGEELSLSEATVRSIVKAIYRKIDVNSRLSLLFKVIFDK